MLRRWWCNKYKLPPTHESFLAYTIDELWLEFYEDYYEKNKDKIVDFEEGDDVQFVTGTDPEYDELERRMAEGSISDEEVNRILWRWQGLDPDKMEAQQKEQEKVEEAPATTQEEPTVYSDFDLEAGFSDTPGS